MKTVYNYIKEKRINLGFKTKEIASSLGIDQALISKYENGKRLPTRNQVIQLSLLLKLDTKQMLILYTKELLLKYVSADDISIEALNLVREELSSYKKEQVPINKNMNKLLKQIDILKKELDKKRPVYSFKVAAALELEYTFNSNKIEGNTLTLQETNLVINEDLTISGKTMREHLEAINHKDAIHFIKDVIERNIEITESVLLELHSIIVRGIQGNHAGKYRNIQVTINGSDYIPPQAFLVAKQMEDLFIWYRSNKSFLHPVALAAEMHQRLFMIHPFIDGNGQTTRLLMNLVLIQHGLVIANIRGEKDSRLAYYGALDLSRAEENKESFHKLVAETERHDLERYLAILSKNEA
jgi:Fic family protein/DNA-binding XRE family transcriptional regulator